MALCSKTVFLGYVHTVPDRFCSISKVAPLQCKQELMFCCSAEIVSLRSQCEQKQYLSYIFQDSLLICKDHLPARGSIVVSVLIKVFRFHSDHFKNLPDTERYTGAVLFWSKNYFESSVPSVNRSPIQYTFCNTPSRTLCHYLVQSEHHLKADFLSSQKPLTARWQVLPSSQNNFLPSHEYDNLMNIGLVGLPDRGS